MLLRKLLLIALIFGLIACGQVQSASPVAAREPAPSGAAASPQPQRLATPQAPDAPPTIAGCPVLPANNIWNTPVDTLPVHARSAEYIASIGSNTGLHADFGAGLWEGSPIGIPYVVVPGAQPAVNITFDYSDESDPGPYPIPPDAPVEGGGDHHVLVIDQDHCTLHEVWLAEKINATTWTGGSGAIFDLNSNALRPDGWTSADAAGLPVFPGLVRYDEVAAGEINHALRFTASSTQRAYVWPARHFASSITDQSVPPMGQRFRLKQSFDISSLSPNAQVIARAMQKYGLILADNGSDWYISGVPDERWNNDVLHELDAITGDQFEAVDVSSLMVNPDSGQVGSPVEFTSFVFLPNMRR